MRKAMLFFCFVVLLAGAVHAQPAWRADLDSRVSFYQTTDFGILLAGTERSLYGLDGQTGEKIWRRQTGKIQETAVTPVPGTDLVLFSQDLGNKSRLVAVDLVTGADIWQSEKVKGDVMQLAVDPENDLLAVILVKDPRGKFGDNFKRKPVVHVLRLSDGDELWKRDFDSSIEMMPSRFGEGIGDVDFTLDNYRAPLLLDGRLFLFYEGSTSYDARSGSEKEREKFKINEDGLALTEADPVYNESHVFVSGKGRIRAINRRTGRDDWKADDLGIASEMALVGQTLFVRTGGQFTRLKDGEPVEKGPFGVSAVNVETGKTLWRYKGADKGLTNFVFVDTNTIAIADRDDLITISAATGKRITKREHNTDKAQFVLINERGYAVVGGRNEIAAFQVDDPKRPEIWRVRHTAPGRGVFRTVAAVALRAAALYFRYGGLATSALSLARGGISIANAASSFRWSGLKTRFGSVDLTTLASNSVRDYATRRIYAYGSIARNPALLSRARDLQVTIPSAAGIRGRIASSIVDRATPSRAEIRESLFDRLDPVRQMERFSDYLLRRKRVSELRSNHMYFYTDLPRPYDKKGLVGVNVHTGTDARYALVSDPDPMFVTDDVLGLLYSADGNKLQAYDVLSR